MLKNCLFEERVIAKEQRGRVCFLLQVGSSASVALRLPSEAKGPQPPDPCQGTRPGREGRPCPGPASGRPAWGLGQSAGQSSGGPIL